MRQGGFPWALCFPLAGDMFFFLLVVLARVDECFDRDDVILFLLSAGLIVMLAWAYHRWVEPFAAESGRKILHLFFSEQQ